MSNRILILFMFILSGCSEQRIQDQPLNLDLLRQKLHQGTPRDSLYQYAQSVTTDSLRLKLLFEYSYYFLQERDSANFFFWNDRSLRLAENLKDTARMAETYWDRASYFYNKGLYDSSYYNYKIAYHNYRIVDEKSYMAKMLYSMAVVQKDLRDYHGSESTTVEAIKLFESIGDQEGIYYGYNNLAVIYNNFEQFETALQFHEEALKKAIEKDAPELIATSRNNIGVVYKNRNEIDKAIENFQEGLYVENIKNFNIRLYARLKDNLAYAKLISTNFNSEEVYSEMVEAKMIRDSISDKPGVSISNIHLAEYALRNGDTTMAKNRLVQAYQFAREIESASDILYILKKLSSIDTLNSYKYLTEYIGITDSLAIRERRVRNKFARTKYETDKIEQANKVLTNQRGIIAAGSLGLILIISLLYFVIAQRIRNKKLKLEQTQIRNNQEIYQLLLNQHEKLEEGRRIEKKRISRELHDGILGKLFGVRFLLSNLISGRSKNTQIEGAKYISELKDIEEEIRLISHNLSDSSYQFDDDFSSILQNFLYREESTSGIKFQFDLEDDNLILNTLPILYKINIYRIIQEAVYNVIKHADATTCKLDIKTSSEFIIIRIIDNGNGFKRKQIKQGIGLKNIQERAKEMNGTFDIESQEGITEVRIILNINYESEK